MNYSLSFFLMYSSWKIYWIGARRICNSAPRNQQSFLWLDESPMEVQWWNGTEPKNGEKNCVAFSKNASKYTWLDFACTQNVYPICQFRLQSRK